MNADFEVIVDELLYLSEDGVPKNVKKLIDDIIALLHDESLEESTRVNKALAILEDISNDNNLDPISRTQFLSISSSLESLLL